jgi:hypothetical protein
MQLAYCALMLIILALIAMSSYGMMMRTEEILDEIEFSGQPRPSILRAVWVTVNTVWQILAYTTFEWAWMMTALVRFLSADFSIKTS